MNEPRPPQPSSSSPTAHSLTHSPVCPRLFGNRSFCFEKLQEYEKALTDAQLSINMAPGWDKGLYRMGRALVGLKVRRRAWKRPATPPVVELTCTFIFVGMLVAQQQSRRCGYPENRRTTSWPGEMWLCVIARPGLSAMLTYFGPRVDLLRALCPLCLANLDERDNAHTRRAVLPLLRGDAIGT